MLRGKSPWKAKGPLLRRETGHFTAGRASKRPRRKGAAGVGGGGGGGRDRELIVRQPRPFEDQIGAGKEALFSHRKSRQGGALFTSAGASFVGASSGNFPREGPRVAEFWKSSEEMWVEKLLAFSSPSDKQVEESKLLFASALDSISRRAGKIPI